MAGKPSSERYRAMLAEVEKAASAAFEAKSDANPYPVDDKRHDRFRRAYNRLCAGAWFWDDYPFATAAGASSAAPQQ